MPYFILSFSCDHDNQLLWSNFAHFDGINLEIDFAKFERELNHIIRWHGLVNYNLESQKECLRKTFYKELLYVEDFGKIKSLKEINGLTGEKYEMIITHIAIICTLYSMFFKRNHFNGENEYRFVFCNLSADYINFRIRKDLIVPYIEKKVKDIDFITKITLGPTNKSDMAVNGIRELLHHYNKDVDVVRSKIQLRF